MRWWPGAAPDSVTARPVTPADQVAHNRGHDRRLMAMHCEWAIELRGNAFGSLGPWGPTVDDPEDG